MHTCTYLSRGEEQEHLLGEEIVIAIVARNVRHKLVSIFRARAVHKVKKNDASEHRRKNHSLALPSQLAKLAQDTDTFPHAPLHEVDVRAAAFFLFFSLL